MARRNSISVPRDVAGRFRGEEQVKHELMKENNGVCLWKSILNRSHIALPDSIKYHVTEDGSGCALLIPDEERAIANFNYAVDMKANTRNLHPGPSRMTVAVFR